MGLGVAQYQTRGLGHHQRIHVANAALLEVKLLGAEGDVGVLLDILGVDDDAILAHAHLVKYLAHQQVQAAAAKGVRIVPVVCSGLEKDGELLMREISLFTNGTSFFLTDDSGIGDTHLKPTTDTLKVEHLNDMLVRTIIEFSTMPECEQSWSSNALDENETDAFVPNPFEVEDLDSVPTTLPTLPVSEVLIVRPNPCRDVCFTDLPLGADALFLCDISGKTIQTLGAVRAGTVGMMIDTSYLPTGVYFVKAFYGGRWYTKKLIVA